MKANRWKIVLGCVICFLLGMEYSGRSAAAQFGQSVQVKELTGSELSGGPATVPGEIKGFSCVAEVDADLIKGDGIIHSADRCYVLSK